MQQNISTFFNDILEFYNLNHPLVVFRKPNENVLTAYIQKSEELHYLNSFKEKGFVFAPFDINEKKILFPLDECKILTSEISNSKELEIAKSQSGFVVSSVKNSKQNHIQLVQKGIDFIKNKSVKKVVLSREENLKCTNFNAISTLKRMLNLYKNAFVYLWYHPKVGLWMGATPERLITISQGKFKTMALAGTQLYKNSINVRWLEKEKQEQQYVTDFILDTINKSLVNVEVSDAYSVRAGNLLHIRTDISGDLKTVNSLELLVNTLHPTPAVCGLPKEGAIEFIKENEGYNRAFYAGYLGELNTNGSTNLFVNLRCMQLQGATATLYIGGGITEDSNSVREWEETVSKSEVMKKVL